MNVGQLKKLLEKFDDDVTVIVSDFDAAYISPVKKVNTVDGISGSNRFYYEYIDTQCPEDNKEIFGIIIE